MIAIFDTNALLRCILLDDKETAEAVEERMNRKLFLVPTEVIAEMVYVLLKVYKIDRKTIEAAIIALLHHEHATTPVRPVTMEALRLFGETKLDFVDCLMVGYAKVLGHRVITFDKELQKYVNKIWIE